MVSKAKLEKFHEYLWVEFGEEKDGIINSPTFKQYLQVICDVEPDRTETLRNVIKKMYVLGMIAGWEGDLKKPLGIRTIKITNPFLDKEDMIKDIEKSIEDFKAKMREEKEE